MITPTLSGSFAEHPEILWHFDAEPVMDADGNVALDSHGNPVLEAEIVEASDEQIVYSDGFILRDPLRVTGICQPAYENLVLYLDHALERRREPLADSVEDRTSQLLGDALDLWETDLQHRFGEYEAKPYSAKPKHDLDLAVADARANKHLPIAVIAGRHDVAYARLALELRQRTFTEAA